MAVRPISAVATRRRRNLGRRFPWVETHGYHHNVATRRTQQRTCVTNGKHAIVLRLPNFSAIHQATLLWAPPEITPRRPKRTLSRIVTTSPTVGRHSARRARVPRRPSRRPRSTRRRWRCPGHRGRVDSLPVIARAIASRAVLNISAASTPAMHDSRTHHRTASIRSTAAAASTIAATAMRDEAASLADRFADTAERIAEFLFPRTRHGCWENVEVRS